MKYKAEWIGTVSATIGLTGEVLDLIKAKEMTDNAAVTEVLGHVIFIGNLCWYIGIPITVIYLLWKYAKIEEKNGKFEISMAQHLEARIEQTKSSLSTGIMNNRNSIGRIENDLKKLKDKN